MAVPDPGSELPTTLDYLAIVAAARATSLAQLVEYLSEELPYMWRDGYLAASSLPTSIMRITHGSFEYFYDNYTMLEAKGDVPYHPTAESRLVAVHGASKPQARVRDDGRLRGWVGPTERTFGRQWDKGHFIAHSMGGAVNGVEANVFIQRRDFNRGWSAAGKRFRAMEQYCVDHPGTYCFSRPLYVDETAKPSSLEFGLLRDVDDLWVARFANSY